MSVSLQKIVTWLPRTLSSRFSSEFWIRKANEVLMDMEQMGEIPRTKCTEGIIINEGLNSYRIPEYMSKVLNVYDKDEQLLRFKQEGLWLNLPDLDASELIDSSLVSLLVLPDKRTFTFDLKPLDTEAKYVLQHISASGVVKGVYLVDRLISSTNITGSLEKTIDLTIEDTDSFDLYKNPALIEFTRFFNSITDIACEVIDDMDIPPVIEAGLRYYAELQTEEEGEFTNRTYQAYKIKLKDWYRRQHREMRLKPRHMPRF